MSKNLSVNADENTVDAPSIISQILRLNRLGYCVEFKPNINGLGTAFDGSIVFTRAEPDTPVMGWIVAPVKEEKTVFGIETTLQGELRKLQHGHAPDNLHWRIDLFDESSVAAAIKRFCDLFERDDKSPGAIA